MANEYDGDVIQAKSVDGEAGISAGWNVFAKGQQRAKGRRAFESWTGHENKVSKLLVGVCIAALVVILNAVAFVLFMLDKHLAQERQRRIPESTLLLVALVGGSAGAIAGQQYWRHKTQKEPFRSMLFVIAAFQVAALGWLFMG